MKIIGGPESNNHDGDNQEADANGIKVLFTIVGTAIGFLIVRGFMLDSLEEIAWRIFWDTFVHGHISTKGWEEIFKSATFTKLIVGMAIGGFCGFQAASKSATASYAAKKRNIPPQG